MGPKGLTRTIMAGYTTFDVAPFYGQTERWLGEITREIPDPAERGTYRFFSKFVPPPGVERLSR
jgi:aryl-alcohol dehydrogenase-like predicted oxidoreductase